MNKKVSRRQNLKENTNKNLKCVVLRDMSQRKNCCEWKEDRELKIRTLEAICFCNIKMKLHYVQNTHLCEYTRDALPQMHDFLVYKHAKHLNFRRLHYILRSVLGLSYSGVYKGYQRTVPNQGVMHFYKLHRCWFSSILDLQEELSARSFLKATSFNM